MRVLIGYDVCTLEREGRKRLRMAAQACKDYGTRVQKSLFECTLSDRHWVDLEARLMGIIDPDEDSLRIYYIDSDTRVEHHGLAKPIDLTDTLII